MAARLTPEQKAIRDLVKENDKLRKWITGRAVRNNAVSAALGQPGVGMLERMNEAADNARALLP